jgi:quinoprotein dehydrogenase-associated probable ABC transporter substrate-binding protein
MSSRLRLRRSKTAGFSRGLFLLHAPNDKPSILIVCGFNGTFVRRGCRYSSEIGNHGGPEVQQISMTYAGRKRWLAIAILAVTALVAGRDAAQAQIKEAGDLSIELVDPKVLRVCADPHNLPFSNEKGEGFENKLAELFAEKLQKKLDYMYFPQATGFVRMTLGAHRCDVIMGFPQGDDMVQGTNPYYRTAYALVAKRGSGLEDVASLEDERLKGKHIGIVAGTPPGTNMAVNGLMANAKPYQLMVDTRIDSSAEAMINDLTSGKIDAGILWGPMAGFYAKNANPPLHVTPLVKEKTGPRLAFRIGMGVRGADQNWKRLLNRLIQENQPAINKILLDYGVPLLDENDRPIGAETATKTP